MDINDYLPMFLEEAREHLQELNLAVVSIEENPSDRETVDLIFRLAHTFKGMSATMGFSHIAELTHAMEDVFELLRQRTDGLEREAIDVLFECLDALSGAIEVIESEGEERIDAEPLIANLRGLVRPRSTQQRIEASGGITAPSELMEKAAGRRLLHACVRLAENTTMPAVRAFMVLQAAAEIGEVVGSAPALESVESFDGDKIELGWPATASPARSKRSCAVSATSARSRSTRARPTRSPNRSRPSTTRSPTTARRVLPRAPSASMPSGSTCSCT